MQEDSTEPTLSPLEVHGRRRSYFAELGVWGTLLLLSALLALAGLPGGGPPGLLWSLIPRLGGAMGTLLFLGLGRNVVRLLRDPRPALHISEEGVLNRTYSSSAELVPWEDILEIRETRLPTVLEIVLRDPEAVRRRQTLTTRNWMRLTSLFAAGPFLVYLPQLEASRGEVLHQLSATLDAVQLNGVRDQRLLDDRDGPQ